MTMTRAWRLVAVGMILTGLRTIALHVVNLNGISTGFHDALMYAARGIFYVGLAIAALGIVQVARAATRAVR